jgi:UDP-N-acetylmuramoylalanine--D-glutamate ligase
MSIIAADTHYLVVGLGATGLSCVRYLVSAGKKVSVADSRLNPPNSDLIKNNFPQVDVHLGEFDLSLFKSVQYLVVSPGVPLSTSVIQQAISSGVSITSDVELFLNEHQGKVVAITGSNAKSTVTAWLGDALKNDERSVLVAGNIGVPVLDTLDEKYDIAVLELSSFQLELIPKVGADIATILNVSEDHMDRYDSMVQYQAAKQRVYFGCKAAIFYKDDILTQPLVPDNVKKITFSSGAPDLKQYGFIIENGEEWLSKGFEKIIKANDISLSGKHNKLNALSVLALADALDSSREATVHSLKNYQGLPYRCELVKKENGVSYINDSKATNVGSTIAALQGLVNVSKPNIILLMGGQSKGQDLSPLKAVLKTTCKAVYAFGEDKDEIQELSSGVKLVPNLESAVSHAKKVAKNGDVVLLSPACASFDQFRNFEERGLAFNNYVGVLIK